MFESNPYNALGIVFTSLEKEKQRQIKEFAASINPALLENFRMYIYRDRRNNPAKIEPVIKSYLINQDERFAHCFVPNQRADWAIQRIKELTFSFNS